MARVRVKDRRLGAANSKWNVYFDHLVDAQGNEVRDYLVIEAPNARPDHVTGVCVLPVVEGRFALIKFYRHPLRSELWEAPRGFIDAGETPAEAALRELGEETGLSCAPANLVPLGFYTPEVSTMAARGGLFAAIDCEGDLRPPSDEIGLGALRWFDASEISDLAAGGGIEDAGTLLAYYRYRLHAAQARRP